METSGSQKIGPVTDISSNIASLDFSASHPNSPNPHTNSACPQAGIQQALGVDSRHSGVSLSWFSSGLSITLTLRHWWEIKKAFSPQISSQKIPFRYLCSDQRWPLAWLDLQEPPSGDLYQLYKRQLHCIKEPWRVGWRVSHCLPGILGLSPRLLPLSLSIPILSWTY
jgi:hypothetical protein